MQPICPHCSRSKVSEEWLTCDVHILLKIVRTTHYQAALQHALHLLAGMQRDVEGLEERVMEALEERVGDCRLC